MKTVAVFEAKNRLSELLGAVEQGEEITITRHGTPIARIVGVTEPDDPATRRAATASALARLFRARAGKRLGGSVREAIDSGRT